eukprot:Tbor_TRINITY_DN5883_c1_g6::TRINITY_DN5883_c1_g6_i1::g.6506::m.6506
MSRRTRHSIKDDYDTIRGNITSRDSSAPLQARASISSRRVPSLIGPSDTRNPLLVNGGYGSIEAELRAVDREYTSGAMNAFGGHSAYNDVLVAELSSINKLQIKMLATTNTLVKMSLLNGGQQASAKDSSSSEASGEPSVHRIASSVVEQVLLSDDLNYPLSHTNADQLNSQREAHKSREGMETTDSHDFRDDTRNKRKGGSPSPAISPRARHRSVDTGVEGGSLASSTEGHTPLTTSELHDKAFEDMGNHFSILEQSLGSIESDIFTVQRHVGQINSLLHNIRNESIVGDEKNRMAKTGKSSRSYNTTSK